MSFSNDWTTKDTNEALLNTLGDEQAAAWARFYAIEVDSRPGELEYDRALAAAKRLDAAIVEIVAAELEGRPDVKREFSRLAGRLRSKVREAHSDEFERASAAGIRNGLGLG